MRWVINKGQVELEKELVWTVEQGFMSENEDDEMFKYKRVQRVQGDKWRKEYGEDHLLRSRDLLPFEKFIFENLGGREIVNKILKKQIEETPD